VITFSLQANVPDVVTFAVVVGDSKHIDVAAEIATLNPLCCPFVPNVDILASVRFLN